VRRLRAEGVPHWYEEGLVLFLTGESVPRESRPLDRHRSLEMSLTQPRSEAEMRAAYAAALARVRELAGQKGEAALWQALEQPSAQDAQWFKSEP
jgi:hypothetical protein